MYAMPSGTNGMPKKLRVFIDTSALLAGLNSPNGAAGVILAACSSHRIMPVISRQVIEEAERNIVLLNQKVQNQTPLISAGHSYRFQVIFYDLAGVFKYI